jgi:hypothetical protein
MAEDNPFKVARRIAQDRAWERWEAENPGGGWRPQRVGDDPTAEEVEIYGQWLDARKRLDRKPDGMVGRRRGAELIRARRRVTMHGIWSPK